MGRRVSPALVLLLSLLFVAPVGAQEESDEQRLAAPCVGTTPGVVIETIDFATVDGSIVRACLGYPAVGIPDVLVTATHGIGHVVQESWVHHIERVVADHGVAMVATNYRDNYGFPTLRGAEDTIVLTQLLLDRFPTVTETVLFSVSMGGSVGGIAIAEAPRFTDGAPLWRHWVVAEGVSNVFETYAEAVAAASVSETAADARDGIERETGGTPLEVPDEYRRRSPIFRPDEIAAALETAVFVHAVNDGLVGFHQGASMAAALCGLGVHTGFDPIVTGSGDKDDSTLLDLISDDLEQVNQDTVDLTGHGSESDETHPVMAQTFARLDQLLRGETYDSGCALAVGAEGISRPEQTPPTEPPPPTTAPLPVDPSPVSGPASNLANTGGSVPLAWAVVSALAALAWLGLGKRAHRGR